MSDDRPDTAVARTRGDWGGAYDALTPPLWTSDTYRWPDAETKPSYDYSRTVNPNRDMLAELLAELEGAAGGIVTGSGQSAALLALLPLPADALVVAPHDCYGGTYRLLEAFERQGKINCTLLDQTDDGAVAPGVGDKTAPLWVGTPRQPPLRDTPHPPRP